MNLWIGNLAPDVTDEVLREFLAKYGCPTPSKIERVPGDGTRPAAMVYFEDADIDAIVRAATRLHGMYWQGRSLHVQTTVTRTGGKRR